LAVIRYGPIELPSTTDDASVASVRRIAVARNRPRMARFAPAATAGANPS